MKKLLMKIALGSAIVLASLSFAPAANAGVTAPRYGDHVSYWNCVGPTKNPGNYYDTRWYYYCDWDYDWFAEVFWGKVDRKMVLTPAWYTV